MQLDAGAPALADLETALGQALAAFSVGRNSWLSSLFAPRIERVLFAATKADHIHHSSHDRLAAVMSHLVGRALTLNPFVIFVSIAFWLWVWGPIGGFVAVPSLLIVQSIVMHIFPSTQNLSKIIQRNPQVIILADGDPTVTAASVKQRPGWSAIDAVKNDRICVVDPDIVSRPSPRIVDGLQALAKCLYPSTSF